MNARPHAIAILRRPIWIALLVGASVAFTLGFACATPFAAFAAVAVLTTGRRDALLLAGLVWIANQGVGFVALHYPWTAETLAWGGALGVVALLSVLAAEFGARVSLKLGGLVSSSIAFLCAFGAYEGLLFAASIASQSGLEAYEPMSVARIFAINAAAFVGLFAAARLSESAGLSLTAEGRAGAPKEGNYILDK
jgi:hypothetical protein